YLGLRLVTTVVATAVVGCATIALRLDPDLAALVVLVGAAKACEAVSDVVLGQLQTREQLRPVAISMLGRGVLSVVAIVGGRRWTGDLVAAAAAMAAVAAVWLVLFDLRGIARRIAVRPTFAPALLRPLAWAAAPMGCVLGIGSLVANVPRYAVTAELGTAA